mmetsp:Transcript_23224/g.35859  ORF Transcript_23224/g.35859 Transcript_23224/m.35859 type:complete len:100 (+) Transcript_23224:1044-1343(+)
MHFISLWGSIPVQKRMNCSARYCKKPCSGRMVIGLSCAYMRFNGHRFEDIARELTAHGDVKIPFNPADFPSIGKRFPPIARDCLVVDGVRRECLHQRRQ